MARVFRFLAALIALWSPAGFTEAGTLESVLAEVRGMRGEPGLRTASIGFCLVPVGGEPSEAVGVEADLGMVPASTLKAITTATANEVLGGDFQFETELQHTGSIADDGTLRGALVVRGGGDPTLGASQIVNTFSRWQAALDKAGIRRVEGAVVGDASIFGTQQVPDSWQWNDFGNYYGAGASGLTFHQNQFFCTFRTARVGGPAALLGTDPRLPGIEFFNEMRVGAAGSGDQGYIYGNPYGKVYALRGSVPAGSGSFTIKGSLPDPAFFCARAFTKHLEQRGVPVSQPPTTVRLLRKEGKSLGARRRLLVEKSEPLGDLLVLTNHKSNNLRAECMHRMIGYRRKGDGSPKAAAQAVKEYWEAEGIDLTGFSMADGCGLSRSNIVTPRQVALILREAAQSEDFETFWASLPTAGRSGTLRSIGRGSAAEGRVRAKSGTLDRIRNYAGYVDTAGGRRYAFALFVNHYSGSLWTVKSRIVRVWNRMVAL